MIRSHRKALIAFAQHLRAANRAPATLRVHLNTAGRFLAWVERPLARIGNDDVRRYLAAKADAGVAPLTHAAEVFRLRVFFRALVEVRLLHSSPAEGLVVPRARPRAHLQLSERDVEALLATALRRNRANACSAALALRDRACLELLYSLGLRVSEACGALVVDFNRTDGVLAVRSAKRGRPRSAPLPTRATASLIAYLRHGRPFLAARGRSEEDGALLLTREGKPLQVQVAHLLVNEIAQRAGLRAHPHALRRAVATQLVRAGTGVLAVKELLGHEDLSTTAGYVTVDEDELRRAVERLPGTCPD